MGSKTNLLSISSLATESKRFYHKVCQTPRSRMLGSNYVGRKTHIFFPQVHLLSVWHTIRCKGQIWRRKNVTTIEWGKRLRRMRIWLRWVLLHILPVKKRLNHRYIIGVKLYRRPRWRSWSKLSRSHRWIRMGFSWLGRKWRWEVGCVSRASWASRRKRRVMWSNQPAPQAANL